MLKGYRELQARMKAIGQTEEVMRSITIHGVANAKFLVPRKTGNLGRTIRPGRVTPTSASIVAGGRLRVGYARAVEKGTGPHIIRPRNKKALAWGGSRRLSGTLRSGAKATHFAKVVHHPGTRAHPYLVPGLIKAANEEGVKTIVTLWDGAA